MIKYHTCMSVYWQARPRVSVCRHCDIMQSVGGKCIEYWIINQSQGSCVRYSPLVTEDLGLYLKQALRSCRADCADCRALEAAHVQVQLLHCLNSHDRNQRCRARWVLQQKVEVVDAIQNRLLATEVVVDVGEIVGCSHAQNERSRCDVCWQIAWAAVGCLALQHLVVHGPRAFHELFASYGHGLDLVEERDVEDDRSAVRAESVD
mmetsp:Transcript_6653/g.18065  ORF Transcript_6653/g.18065 Transcript_6653/m.18065 type:complete len:206 (-) Transcript_6653:651-1268(-)